MAHDLGRATTHPLSSTTGDPGLILHHVREVDTAAVSTGPLVQLLQKLPVQTKQGTETKVVASDVRTIQSFGSFRILIYPLMSTARLQQCEYLDTQGTLGFDTPTEPIGTRSEREVTCERFVPTHGTFVQNLRVQLLKLA